MYFIQQTKKIWLKNEDILSMEIYCLGERKLIQGTKLRYLSHNLTRWKTEKTRNQILDI
jgi:hypothetical protein